MSDEENLRDVPSNELDAQMQLTNPKWGQDVPAELKAKLTNILGYYKDEGGILTPVEEKLWGLLSFYTRDIRLANLSGILGEVTYCRYYLDLAGDFLKEGYINAFVVALSRVVTVLELSQSRGGFLRKLLSTIRQEHYRQEIGPKKRSLFGSDKTEV